jgi:ACS family tartrate transporter-like MFS transporter
LSLDLEASALKKVGYRLIPFVALLYFAAFIDRVNVSFAAAQMNRDLGFSAYVYGLGAGIFFIGYSLCEVPSNLILHKVGGRRWLARIMITWAIVAGAMAMVKGATGFYVLRFLLGVAEAGFFPGIVYYLTYWVPATGRARLVGTFMTAIPISTALGGPISSAMRLDGVLGAIPYAMAAIGMVWWSHRSDRKKERVWHLAIASLVACSGLAASAWLVNSPLLSVAAISIGAAGTLAILPIFWTLPAAILEGAAAAGAIAMINALGNVGGFAGPFMIGLIKDATGSFTWGLLAAAGSVLLTGIIAVVIGHDSGAEHGVPAALRGLPAAGRNSTNKPDGRAA